ncbi:ABC transporter ATP-binding protein [Spirillospora sp. CA-142024]|uniref:ABC transporter ATP-binding protein n=1 Tax=Spirillospora sp. CA-142024 TaxID=3240036 RepID=UPI003D924E9A
MTDTETYAPFSASSVRKTLRVYWPETKGDRRLLVAGGVLIIAAALCEVGAIWLFGYITDNVLAAKDLGAFWTPAAAWLVLALVTGVATFGGDYALALAGERFLLRLRDRVFAHLQGLSPEFFNRRPLGDLIARLTDDIESIEELVASGLVRALTSVITIVFFMAAAVVVRWDLALVACALVPLFLLVSKTFSARFKTVADDERRSNGVMTALVEESISNQALVQAYNRQRTQERRLHQEGRTWLRAKMAEARLSAMYEPLTSIVETLCVLVVLGMGAWELTGGRITLGGLLSFAAYLAYLYPPVQSLGQFGLSVAEASAGSDRVLEVLRAQPAVADGRAVRVRVQSRGRIDFSDVSFGYENARRPALEHLSFSVGPGELLLVTGPSGAGKSTIARLMLRFYDPTGGRILLDGVDIRELSLRTLRYNVTLLQQETMLFPGTIHENIAYGRSGAAEADIVAAAVAADAHDFITALPEGYQTRIGEKGRLLSGGQRQRLAIARAMLRNAPVLILDEPTTGLDADTARRVLDPLRRLMAGRTTILITHDLHLAPEADRTVLLGTDPTRLTVPHKIPQTLYGGQNR